MLRSLRSRSGLLYAGIAGLGAAWCCGILTTRRRRGPMAAERGHIELGTTVLWLACVHMHSTKTRPDPERFRRLDNRCRSSSGTKLRTTSS